MLRGSHVVAIVLIGTFIYGGIKAWPLVRGPHITIETLYTQESGVTLVTGVAKNTESMTLNGGTLLIDDQGRFESNLSLPRGGGILTLTATDRFGRNHTLQRAVITP
jgi:hypothetical protein